MIFKKRKEKLIHFLKSMRYNVNQKSIILKIMIKNQMKVN